MAPRDPILGITEAFHADTNPDKINLGVGVYTDDAGRVPLLECVRRADRAILENPSPWSYLPIDGLAAYDKAVQALIFGADSAVLAQGRGVTVQAIGGTGALKICADFLRRVSPGAQVLISNPSWENHRALFEGAGFPVKEYPYYDAATHGLDFAGMAAALDKAPAGTIVVLHVCCHNPTGVDLAAEHWAEVLRIVKARNLIPILDSAYQGFAESIDADGAVVRQFAEACSPVFVASSFSKSFSLYGERVGALSVATRAAGGIPTLRWMSLALAATAFARS
jgi:aromatic-amino-acid transaminase